MKVVTNAIAHRDCCIGLSFPLVAMEKFPEWRKRPASIAQAHKIILTLQRLLTVKDFTDDEARDVQAACEAAADLIEHYDTSHCKNKDEAFSSWCVMWFLGDEAFADALFYGGAWKKRPELWVKAKHLISLTSDRLYLHHQAEAEEAARIWHCHASPRKNPGMEDIWTD
ncbi:MAG: hypothetical protein UDQ58_06655 [Desulfovibrio sp.]|nr:hypothetical protein [Desulfovibrio sp.]